MLSDSLSRRSFRTCTIRSSGVCVWLLLPSSAECVCLRKARLFSHLVQVKLAAKRSAPLVSSQSMNAFFPVSSQKKNCMHTFYNKRHFLEPNACICNLILLFCRLPLGVLVQVSSPLNNYRHIQIVLFV